MQWRLPTSAEVSAPENPVELKNAEHFISVPPVLYLLDQLRGKCLDNWPEFGGFLYLGKFSQSGA